jgi:hypothetical protein
MIQRPEPVGTVFDLRKTDQCTGEHGPEVRQGLGEHSVARPDFVSNSTYLYYFAV